MATHSSTSCRYPSPVFAPNPCGMSLMGHKHRPESWYTSAALALQSRDLQRFWVIPLKPIDAFRLRVKVYSSARPQCGVLPEATRRQAQEDHRDSVLNLLCRTCSSTRGGAWQLRKAQSTTTMLWSSIVRIPQCCLSRTEHGKGEQAHFSGRVLIRVGLCH